MTVEAPILKDSAMSISQVQKGERKSFVPLSISLLTGGQDRHYAVGLGTALMERNVALEVIGSTEIDGPEFQGNPQVRFLNLYGSQQSAGPVVRIWRILAFYIRLFQYALTAKPKIFHILWNNKVQVFDRTLLMVLYKLAGKKIVLTAHNVNAGRRDNKDSWLNRITLKIQYKLANHIFVHTNKMKDELIFGFDVNEKNVTVIPYGINNAVPYTDLTQEEARRRLGIDCSEKVILYFGAIKPYKGLEYLVMAFQRVAAQENYRLVIAGERKKGYEEYWDSIKNMIEQDPSREKILQKIEFIPDSETETYFKAADVAVLSYTEIFQSGILFMTYAYGLPVIATDVGSFREDIVEGQTGFVCRPCDVEDLAASISRYFTTDLHKNAQWQRPKIREYALSKHSWSTVSDMTRDVYVRCLGA
jgi:glycosyltransferase involved in cell wall biosynthesis